MQAYHEILQSQFISTFLSGASKALSFTGSICTCCRAGVKMETMAEFQESDWVLENWEVHAMGWTLFLGSWRGSAHWADDSWKEFEEN